MSSSGAAPHWLRNRSSRRLLDGATLRPAQNTSGRPAFRRDSPTRCCGRIGLLEGTSVEEVPADVVHGSASDTTLVAAPLLQDAQMIRHSRCDGQKHSAELSEYEATRACAIHAQHADIRRHRVREDGRLELVMAANTPRMAPDIGTSTSNVYGRHPIEFLEKSPEMSCVLLLLSTRMALALVRGSWCAQDAEREARAKRLATKCGGRPSARRWHQTLNSRAPTKARQI